jgi:transposase-like protein
MKKTILLLMTATVAEAFVMTPPSRTNHPIVALKQATSDDSHPVLSRMMKALESVVHSAAIDEGDDKVSSVASDIGMVRNLESAQKQWRKEADRLHKLEHAIETDPDLAGLVEPRKQAQKMYIEKESHIHDSLFAEIQHAIETDPDLVNIVREDKNINMRFMEKEAHMHDSLFNEIEHSIDNDPYLRM